MFHSFHTFKHRVDKGFKDLERAQRTGGKKLDKQYEEVTGKKTEVFSDTAKVITEVEEIDRAIIDTGFEVTESTVKGIQNFNWGGLGFGVGALGVLYLASKI